MTQTVAPVSDKQNPGSWTEDGAGTNLYEALDDHPDTSPTDSCTSPSSGSGNYFEVYLGQLSDPTTGNVTVDFYAQRVSGGATVTCTLYCATNGAIGNSGQVTPGAAPTAYQFAVASSAVHSSSWDNATGLWLRFDQDTNNKQVSVSSAQASAADAPAGPSGAIAASATATTATAAATAERPGSIDADTTAATAALGATAERPGGVAAEIATASAALTATITRNAALAASVSTVTVSAGATVTGVAVPCFANPEAILLREPRLLIPRRKPLGKVKLDWSHALCRGLKMYLLVSPSQPACLVTGILPSALGRGAPWKPIEEGIGLRTDTSGQRIVMPAHPNYRLLGDWTLHWRGYMEAVDTGTVSLFGNQFNSVVDGTMYIVASTGTEDADAWIARIVDNGGDNIYGVGGSMPAFSNSVYALTVCWNDSTGKCEFYHTYGANRDQHYSQETNSSTIPFGGLDYPLTINGQRYAVDDAPPDATVLFAAKWNRVLTADEAWAINDDPYQLVVPA